MSAHRRQRCAVPSGMILLAVLTLGACKSSGSPGADAVSRNSPPVISGNPPASTKIGESYSFTPTASDPDGDALTFGIEGKPAWAGFDTATGKLDGIPRSGDEGPYDDISIAASDGAASDSLDFSITVNQIGEGSVKLSWTPPTEYSDGTALTDLAGYNIYYGMARGNYTQKIRIENPGLSIYVVEDLSPNTWYFVITSFNAAGIESDFSGVAEITAN